uniref:RNA helicase n=1 Tax=Nothoprocta perdicaria TaxID=30464 RepID=A0A8C7EDW3_NOTPE
MQPKSEEVKFVTKNDGYVHIHPSSVNYQTRHFESPYLVYHEKIKTSRVFIRDCSMVSVYPLVLLGGGQVHTQLQKGEFVISLDDGWIRFVAASHQLVKELRCELDQLLQDKIKNPSMDLCMCPRVLGAFVLPIQTLQQFIFPPKYSKYLQLKFTGS